MIGLQFWGLRVESNVGGLVGEDGRKKRKVDERCSADTQHIGLHMILARFMAKRPVSQKVLKWFSVQ